MFLQFKDMMPQLFITGAEAVKGDMKSALKC
jgi:hypothetical protein